MNQENTPRSNNIIHYIDWILILILITTVLIAQYNGKYNNTIDHCSGFPYETIYEPNQTCYKVCPPEQYKPQDTIENINLNWSKLQWE